MDLDNARDFHSMGGWPILVALSTDWFRSWIELWTANGHWSWSQTVILQQQLNEWNGDGGGSAVAERGARMEVVLPEATIEFLKWYQRIVREIQSWCLGTSWICLQCMLQNSSAMLGPLRTFSDLMSGNENDANIVNVITIILNNLVAAEGSVPRHLPCSTFHRMIRNCKRGGWSFEGE